MNRREGLFILWGIFLLSFSACKVKEKTPVAGPSRKEARSALSLLAELKKSEFHFQTLSAKLSADVRMDSNDISFTMNLRIRKDSAIWLSISPALGIEAARVLVTNDSVKFMNKLKSQYFTGDYHYINRLLHTDLDYGMLQSVLVGNSVEFYEENEKLRSSVDGDRYLLSTIRKRKLRKVMEKNKELREPVESIWMLPDSYKICRVLINEFNPDRSFDVRYDKQTIQDSLSFPYETNIDIQAEKKISIHLTYSKVNTGTPISFPFSIPSSYEQIRY